MIDKKELPVNSIFRGDNLEVVSDWPDNCIDSIITDPPYGLEFMGKEWDKFGDASIEPTRDSAGGFLRNGKSGSNPYAAARIRMGSDTNSMQQWHYQWAKAMLRITKPGGFLLCFGGTRTFHRLTCAIEDAGWQIRDCMMWLYGSGFPKSHNISKAIDKKAGAKRKSLGISPNNRDRTKHNYNSVGNVGSNAQITAPTTSLAQLWNGYGTALKPAWESIIVAMKPLDGTFAANAEKHGVAGLNIDGGRIPTDEIKKNTSNYSDKGFWGNIKEAGKAKRWTGNGTNNPQGRWPANLILDEEAGKMLDEQSGISKGGKRNTPPNIKKGGTGSSYIMKGQKNSPQDYSDSGGASRFFYCAKTSKRERNLGLEDCEDKTGGGMCGTRDKSLLTGSGNIRNNKMKNNHPTVKPLALMKYLCTLLKMPNPNQVILDPFMGSGTTCMACKELGINFIGIEKEREYCEIALKRINAIGT